MQDKNNITPATLADPADATAAAAVGKATQSDFVRKIVDKIKNSENILIALSKDPSVDEIAAAIGLTLYLDGMQKHATAIYSGHTPDELSFLQPSQTFEKTTDSLQDFIISLNKDKADHLRYKLEGDFVKVFITPYKARLTEEDLNFSYGDYNVDFVVAMNVPAAASLDEALREHGRVMHDASVVNITTGDAGKFGEIEWSNPAASSICEMTTELVFALKGEDESPLEQDVATALLTGIVAATERFSNNRTHSDTLSLASKLMSMGADQQLISANVRGNDIVHNDKAGHAPIETARKDKTNLTIEHEEDGPSMNPYAKMSPAELEAARAGGAVNPMVSVGMPNVAGGLSTAAMAGMSAGVGVYGTVGSMGIAGVNTVDGANAPSVANVPVVNPATQVAPPQSPVTDPAGAISATNNVTPEDVVVQPIIPNPSNPSNPGAANPLAVSNPAGADSATTSNVPVANNGPLASENLAGNGNVAQMADVVANGGASQMPDTAVNDGASQLADATVNNNITQPGAPNATEVAETAGGRTVLAAEPEAPTERQFGMAIQPPAPQAKPEKNYAEMMAEALAEPLPGENQNLDNAQNVSNNPAGDGVPGDNGQGPMPGKMPTIANPIGAAQVPNMPNMTPVPPAEQFSAVNPSSEQLNIPGMPVASDAAPTVPVMPMMQPPAATPAMEPVANPNEETILPPPPAPNPGGDMMPPVLPPVQGN